MCKKLDSAKVLLRNWSNLLVIKLKLGFKFLMKLDLNGKVIK